MMLNSLMTPVSSTFLSTNLWTQFLQLILKFLKICFKTNLNVCEMTHYQWLHFVTFASQFFAWHFWKRWKMMMSSDGFPIHTNAICFFISPLLSCIKVLENYFIFITFSLQWCPGNIFYGGRVFGFPWIFFDLCVARS